MGVGSKSAREVMKRAREGNRPDRGTKGGQKTSLVVVTARVKPLIRTQWRSGTELNWIGTTFVSHP